MVRYIDSKFGNALWAALSEAPMKTHPPRDKEMVKASTASGWMTLDDLEYFLRDRDYRLTTFFRRSERQEFVAGFGYAPKSLFKRENMTSRPLSASFGQPSLPIADVANLLIDLEAIGFHIDPTEIVSTILPGIQKKDPVTDQEISVLWYKGQRFKVANNFQVRGPKQVAFGAETKTLKLDTGHKVEAHLWADGQLHWMSILPPNYRSRSRSVA